MFIAEAVNKDWKNNSHYDDMGNGARFQLRGMDNRKWKENWPWDDHDGRKSSSMLSCLVKAGALIAAEIDRLNEI